MEEDIKILEEFLNKFCEYMVCTKLSTESLNKLENAIENLLKRYKYLDNFIHSNSCVLQNKNGELVAVLLTPENFIPISVIQNKYIEMQKEYERKVNDKKYNTREVKLAELYKSQVYEELLEERNK